MKKYETYLYGTLLEIINKIDRSSLQCFMETQAESRHCLAY